MDAFFMGAFDNEIQRRFQKYFWCSCEFFTSIAGELYLCIYVVGDMHCGFMHWVAISWF
jgi:hypothetical protein